MKIKHLFKINIIVSVLLLILIYLVHSTDLSAFLFGPKKASLGFTGDIMMHYRVKSCAKAMNIVNDTDISINNEGFDFLFEEIKPRLSEVDFMVGNMEFPVSPPFIQKHLLFNAPQQVIPAIKKSGFDLVSIANNHILDQYMEGLFDTISYLNKYELPCIGVAEDENTARSGYVKNINGIKVGFLAYTGIINFPERRDRSQAYMNWVYDRDDVLADIASMKTRADFIVLQVHTGVEYVITPREMDRAMYKEYADAGVDLVIGHHPHILQYMEQYVTTDNRTVEIFYSLGNFIADQNKKASVRNTGKVVSTRDAAIVQCFVEKQGTAVSHKVRVVPVHTWHEFKVTGDGVKYKEIQTVPVSDKLAELYSELDSYAAGDSEYENTNSLIKFYEYRHDVIEKTIFPDGIPEGVKYM